MQSLIYRCIVAFAIAGIFGVAAIPSAARADSQAPATREGCLSQWMFNGIWRVRITKVDPIADDGGKQIGWLVTEVWRNGTMRTFAPVDTFASDQVLVLANGAKIAATDSTLGTLSSQDVLYHSFPPSSQYTHQQKFLAVGAFDPSVKAVSVIIPFDSAREAGRKDAPQYSVTPASYKVKLDCVATAQQQAQGGSFELPAQQGCLNQWVANGLWKMRVTKVEPEMDNGAQIGWLVTQDWLNISGRKIAPGNSFLSDEELVLSNDDTVSSGNATVTTLQAQQLAAHTIDSGSSFTHAQNFRYFRPAFDPSNKPKKFLVTFDEGQFKYFVGKPMPVHPPNFRIQFNCHK